MQLEQTETLCFFTYGLHCVYSLYIVGIALRGKGAMTHRWARLSLPCHSVQKTEKLQSYNSLDIILEITVGEAVAVRKCAVPPMQLLPLNSHHLWSFYPPLSSFPWAAVQEHTRLLGVIWLMSQQHPK